MASTHPLHVIFGTGPVGMAVKDALQQRGDVRIRMVNRSGRTSEPLPPDVELVSGDASDPDFAARAAEGAAVVYNAMNPPAYHLWETLLIPLWQGVINAATANSTRLVSIDNLYMYGDTGGQPIHEELPFSAKTKKGQIRARANEMMMAAHGQHGVEVTIAHASDYIGPRTYGAMLGGDLVIHPALEGRAATLVGDPSMPHSYTYTPDIGRALVDLAHADDAFGRRWHVPSLEPLPTVDIVRRIYQEAGNPIKIQNPPTFIIRLMGLFNPNMREMVEMMYEFNQPFIIDTGRFEAHFGWEATPLDQAIQATVAWFRENPKS